MKVNFCPFRNAIFVILCSFAFTNAFSQNSLSAKPVTTNLKAIVENNNILLNWNVPESNTFNYCKVQASTDGVTYYTIGMVMGAIPGDADKTTFAFKQNLTKIRPGQAYYRVLNVAADETAYVSNVAKIL